MTAQSDTKSGRAGSASVRRSARGASSPRAGVDLGGTKIQAAVIDRDGLVLGQARRPTPPGGPVPVAEEITGAVRDAAADAGVEASELAGVGVGAPGDADPERGTVDQAMNVSPDWTEPYPLGATLGEALGTDVAIGNDVQVATDAEFHLGGGRPYGSLLGVFWGTGVGGGIVLDGRPWTGRGAAGEIGHTLVKRGGARCICGRRGCVEAYAGRAAMERRARRELKKGRDTRLFELMEERGKPKLTSGVWARALREGDELAEELIDRAVKALGAGIASALNLLDVDAVVLGGGLGVRFGDSHLERIEQAMRPHLFTIERPAPLHVAELGDLGGAIGAALLVPSPTRRAPARSRSKKAAGGDGRRSTKAGTAAAKRSGRRSAAGGSAKTR